MPMFKATATLWTLNDGKLVDRAIEKFQLQEMSRGLRAFLRACVPRIPVRTGFLRSAFKPMREMVGKNTDGAGLNPELEALFNVNPDNGRHSEEVREIARSRFRERDKYNDAIERPDRPKMTDRQKATFDRNRAEADRANHRRWRKTKAGRAAGKRHKYQEYYYYGRKQRHAKTMANALKHVSPKDPGDIIKTSGMVTTVQFDVAISYYRINDFFSRITGSPWRSLDAGYVAMINYLEKAATRFPQITEFTVTQRLWLRGSRVGKEDGNEVSNFRRRFAGGAEQKNIHDAGGLGAPNIKGAKMTPYPAGSTKPQLVKPTAAKTKLGLIKQRDYLKNKSDGMKRKKKP